MVAAAYDDADQAVRTLVRLTKVPVRTEADARAVYEDWRLRRRIEHGYRFDPEQGLDVEDMRVQTLARMQRVFAVVLLAAQFAVHLMTVGHPRRCSGCASWAENWRWRWTGMAPTASCAG